jgi:DNA-binding transcriptional ArsR family regulator
MKDEMDAIPQDPDSCEIKSPIDHKLMFKTLENPLRRKIIKSIGEFGKTKEDIMKEVAISEYQLNFQLEYLIKECYAEFDGDMCKLNSKGIDELLVNIIKPLK